MAAVLLAFGGTSWVLLSYGLPLQLTGRSTARPVLAGANGTWFLWAVATESIAVGLTVLPSSVPGTVTILAVVSWAAGVVLYLLAAGLVTAALLAVPVDPTKLTSAYLVSMGATVISMLAGVRDPAAAG